MKKFFVLLFVLLMISPVANASTFDDTKGLNCEYAVDRIAYLNIVNGTGANKFEPEKAVTRAELSKMITSVISKKELANDKSFSDVEGHWGKEYIKRAASLGILNGYSDGTFKPDNKVTYAEAIAIIIRSLGYNDLEKNTSGAWYENYISKMKDIDLDDELGNFNPGDAANRGDIAIILWNMIKSEYRVKGIANDAYVYGEKTFLEECYSDYNYWNNVEITDMTIYGGSVVYVTSKGSFYKNSDIDFSDLGGVVSGFYDEGYNIVIGLKIDEGIEEEKISGSLNAITSMGYSPYKIPNVVGFGDRDHAEYVEIFVDKETNKILRTVYFDTRESHFAEQIKIGDSKVSIESKDLFDKSIVLLKNGKMITYNILRTESVMSVNIDALVVYNGEIVEWKSIPTNSVIREIVKNKLYTYTHKYIDGKVESEKINFKTLKVNNAEYVVSDDCICQNVITKQTMKLKESLTREDIKTIIKEDGLARVYLNEFDEIVKFEFKYDIWAVQEEEKKADTNAKIDEELNRFGFIVSKSYNVSDKKEGYSLKISSMPKERSKFLDEKDNKFNIGDFVYLPSGENKIEKVSDKLKVDNIKIVLGYNYEIQDNKIGIYSINKDTQIAEVVLKHSGNSDGKYSDCELRAKTLDELSDYTKYTNIHLIVDEDGIVIRLYAVKEIGTTYNVGIINKINEKLSGDKVVSTLVYVTQESKYLRRYSSDIPVMGYSVGDLITYRSKEKGKNESENKIIVNEVYKHELIGNEKDLVVQKNINGTISFQNSDSVFDVNNESFKYDGKIYYFEDYLFIEADVKKDDKTDSWFFEYFKINNKLSVRNGTRIAIDELTGTIVTYNGYKD